MLSQSVERLIIGRPEHLAHRICLCPLHFNRSETPSLLFLHQNQIAGNIGKAYFTRNFGYNGAHL